MIPSIKSDRAGQPRVELGGDGLYSTYVSECVLVLLLWDMSGIDHVHCFYLRRKFLLSPRVRTSGLLIVVTVQPLVLVFGVYLAGLFEYPSISIGMVG